MKHRTSRILSLAFALGGALAFSTGPVTAQDEPAPAPLEAPAAEAEAPVPDAPLTVKEKADQMKEKAKDLAGAAAEKTKELAGAAAEKTKELAGSAMAKGEELANTEEGKKAAGTVIDWIESIDKLYRPWINWILVAVGIALFISHAGQLVVGKLWGLIRGRGFDLGEVLNDFLVAGFAGLSLPAVLLIPTGQGRFMESPFAVLSAAAVGMVLGVYLYGHGVSQEMRAGRKDPSDDKKD